MSFYRITIENRIGKIYNISYQLTNVEVIGIFGYVKPCTAELKVGEYELYKAFYCGLCRSLGTHICRTSEFTLSYDLVFLAIVRFAAANEEPVIKRRRCAVHPFKKRPYVETCKPMEYTARSSALLTYYKIADDVNDTKGAKRLKRRIALKFAGKYRKKADIPELDRMIAERIAALSALEKERSSVEKCADEFGKTLGDVFAFSFGDPETERILYNAGFHIGRWIYYIDAVDDFDDDKKTGDFNPLETFEELPASELGTSMNLDLEAAGAAFELLYIKNKKLYNTIKNIIYIGMPETAEKILRKNETKDGDK